MSNYNYDHDYKQIAATSCQCITTFCVQADVWWIYCLRHNAICDNSLGSLLKPGGMDPFSSGFVQSSVVGDCELCKNHNSDINGDCELCLDGLQYWVKEVI